MKTNRKAERKERGEERMGASKMCELAAVVAVVMALTMAGVGEAQTTASCASNLVPCAPYLNSTSPPANCCTPLIQTIQNDRECLCNLYKNPSLLESLRINITQALELPKHCGLSDDISACNVTSPSPTGSPPATPGNDNNGASMVAGTGISCLLLLCASLML